jgi:hypothetical protein
MPSWKTGSSVFDAIPDLMGVRADVFDGSRPNIEKILSIYFSAFGLLEAPPRGIMRSGSE